MRIGIILPLFSGDPGRVVGAAREAEELGFDGVFAFDHFFPPGAPSDRPSLEAFTTLGAVAAATERVKVGTLVTRASIRPVGLLAKTASWLDAASEGRLVLGVGTGDPIDLPEHQAYGIRTLSKTERREHLEEAVKALKALFAGEAYPGGPRVPPLRGPIMPPPAQEGGPPIWIGAQADPVVALAGRIADGWNGWGLDPQAFAGKVRLLNEEARGRRVDASWAGIVLVGRDRPETRELLERRRARGMDDEAWVGTAEELVKHLDSLSRAGAAWVVMVLAGPADRRVVVGKEVLSAVQPAVYPDRLEPVPPRRKPSGL